MSSSYSSYSSYYTSHVLHSGLCPNDVSMFWTQAKEYLVNVITNHRGVDLLGVSHIIYHPMISTYVYQIS